ncbi:hypothetical protein ABIA85_009106 [Bradyrhizobium sp. LA6.10]
MALLGRITPASKNRTEIEHCDSCFALRSMLEISWLRTVTPARRELWPIVSPGVV